MGDQGGAERIIMAKYDRRANQLAMERLRTEIELHDVIERVGLQATLLALLDLYPTINVEQVLHRITANNPTETERT